MKIGWSFTDFYGMNIPDFFLIKDKEMVDLIN